MEDDVSVPRVGHVLNFGQNLTTGSGWNRWISVSGTGTAQLAASLYALESRCGPITERIVPSGSNWCAIKFSNASSAQKCLNLDGSNLVANVTLRFEAIGQADIENLEQWREKKFSEFGFTMPQKTIQPIFVHRWVARLIRLIFRNF
eukprot:Trichotokara_eunicae@DN6299_c0_g1_i1.p1